MHVLSLLLSLSANCCFSLLTQTNFRFAGALKFEEVVRALSSMFSRYSSVPMRGKFSRLREILLVLTSDSGTSSGGPASGGGLITDNFTQLTAAEVEAFVALRVDLQQQPAAK